MDMDYSERMRSVYTEEELHEMDRSVHVKLGHSNLSAHFAAPRYTTDYLECRKLITVIEDEMAWFEISRLDTAWRSPTGEGEGQNWEVVLINGIDLTVRGPTMEIAIAKSILLDGVLEKRKPLENIEIGIDITEPGGEDGPQEEE